MKSTILVFTLVVLACLCSCSNANHMNNPVEHEKNCNNVKGDLSLHYGICGRITCQPDGSITAVGCGTHQCAEGAVGVIEKETDPSKPYPDCCGGPICPGE